MEQVFRDIFRKFHRCVLPLFLLMLLPFTLGIKVNRDYRVLQIPVQIQPGLQSGEHIEVRLLISHDCGECYEFVQYWEQWHAKQPEDVVAVESYIIMGAKSEIMTTAYWVAEELSLLPQVESYLRIVATGGQELPNSKEGLVEIYKQFGMLGESIERAQSSINVVKNIRKTKALNKIYRIRHVPSIVVNGKYITDISSAGSYDTLFSVTEYLIEKERISKIPQHTQNIED